MCQTNPKDKKDEDSIANAYEKQQQAQDDSSPEPKPPAQPTNDNKTTLPPEKEPPNPDMPPNPALDTDRLERLVEKLEDCLINAEPVVNSLADNISIFEENVRSLDMNRTYFKSDLDRRESLQEQIKKLSHHLENTTTYYYNQQNDLPKKIEKSYEQLVQKHSSKYQKMLQQVAKIFEEESGNTKLNSTYVYINAAFLFLQTCILLFFLR